MIINIYGIPVAQPRHDVTTRGGFAHAYIPEKHKIHAWKALIQDKCGEATGFLDKAVSYAVSVDLVFTLPRMKSYPKATHPINPKSGDIDNLSKAVLDALNGIIYKDDSQVYKLTATKQYGKDLGVRIEIK